MVVFMAVRYATEVAGIGNNDEFTGHAHDLFKGLVRITGGSGTHGTRVGEAGSGWR